MAEVSNNYPWIVPLSELLTWKNMIQIGVKYLGFSGRKMHIILDKSDNNRNEAVKSILYSFAGSTTEPKERLAYYLKDSELVDQNDVKTILGPGTRTFERCQPAMTGNFSSDVLLELSKAIATTVMNGIAQEHLGFSSEEIGNKRYENIRNSELFNLAILETYALKNFTPEDLKEKLLQSAKYYGNVNGNKIQRIFDNFAKQQEDSKPLDKTDTQPQGHTKESPSGADGGGGLMEDSDTDIKMPKKIKDIFSSGKKGEDFPDTGTEDQEGDYYDMSADPPGYVLIIDNVQFQGLGYRNRSGENVEKLKKLFSDRGFKVIVEKNLSSKMMVAVAKVFARFDDIPPENYDDFITQFQLTQDDVEKMIGDKNLGRKYMLSTEDRKDLDKNFEIIGRAAFKRKCKFNEEEMMQLESDRAKMGKDEFEQNYKITDDFKKVILNELMDGTFGRENFVCRSNLGKKEIDEIQNKFRNFGKEAFRQKYELNEDGIKQLKESIEKFKREIRSFSDTKCLVVIVMSHGRNGKVYGSDGKPIDLNNFLLEFSSDNCRAMAGKPKLFLIQACRGDQFDTETDKPEEHEEDMDYVKVCDEVIPRSADMITGYATTAGVPANRFVLTDKFCEVVEKYGDSMDILSLTTKVNKSVADSLKDRRYRQISEFHTTLRKKWKLPAKNTE